MKPLLALLFFTTTAQAAVVGYVDSPDGRIEFHNEQGACHGKALRAEYVSADQKTRIPGCWTAQGSMLAVVFMDGDAGTVPMQAVRKPDPA